MKVTTSTRALLTEHDLVDAEVDLDEVGLHTSGPPTWYLRTIRKSAITLGNHVWFSSEEKLEDVALVAHELVHVGQYARLGRAKFLATYMRDMAKAGFKYSSKLPLEAPAYERQRTAKSRLAGRVDR